MTGLRSSNQFSLGFKLKVIDEANRGELSLKEISELYGIRGHSTISKWMRKLDGKTSILSKKSDYELRQRIKELEKLLEHERLKRLASDTMIDVAEEQLKITIRKKSDSKQSKG